MARTALDICNRALAKVGSDIQIASLNDDSAEAAVCKREYEDTFLAALTMPGGRPFRWSFATAQKALVRLSGVPVARYAYAWQIEPGTLMLHAVMVNDIPISYARLDDMIYCDAAENVVAEYTFTPVIGETPPPFIEALVTEMASKVAMGLNRDLSLAEMLAKNAALAWAGARAADSQARTSRRIRANRLRVSRFG